MRVSTRGVILSAQGSNHQGAVVNNTTSNAATADNDDATAKEPADAQDTFIFVADLDDKEDVCFKDYPKIPRIVLSFTYDLEEQIRICYQTCC